MITAVGIFRESIASSFGRKPIHVSRKRAVYDNSITISRLIELRRSNRIIRVSHHREECKRSREKEKDIFSTCYCRANETVNMITLKSQ